MGYGGGVFEPPYPPPLNTPMSVHKQFFFHFNFSVNSQVADSSLLQLFFCDTRIIHGVHERNKKRTFKYWTFYLLFAYVFLFNRQKRRYQYWIALAFKKSCVPVHTHALHVEIIVQHSSHKQQLRSAILLLHTTPLNKWPLLKPSQNQEAVFVNRAATQTWRDNIATYTHCIRSDGLGGKLYFAILFFGKRDVRLLFFFLTVVFPPVDAAYPELQAGRYRIHTGFFIQLRVPGHPT